MVKTSDKLASASGSEAVLVVSVDVPLRGRQTATALHLQAPVAKKFFMVPFWNKPAPAFAYPYQPDAVVKKKAASHLCFVWEIVFLCTCFLGTLLSSWVQRDDKGPQ